jgi:Tol biopolymer transport system component
MPVWSPDGTRIAFGSKRAGKWGLYLKLADGTGSEELLTESELPKAPMSWSPDGKMLVYEVIDPKTHGDVWAVPLTGDRKPIAILQSQFDEQMPQVSADGKWIAYQSDETDTPQIYIKPFPAGAGKWQVSTDRGVWPRWRRDGKELFFYDPPNMMAAEIAVAGSSIKSGTPHLLFGTGNPNSAHATPYLRYAVSADGQRFLFPQPGGGPINSGGLADAIINAVDNPQTANTGANATTVVLNWTHMLKQK